jgi:hypothetical protein
VGDSVGWATRWGNTLLDVDDDVWADREYTDVSIV